MPQFLIVHDVKVYPETQDDWIGLWRKLRERAHGEAEWLHSFFEPSTGKLYCEWEAPDVDSILSCLSEEVLDLAPVSSTSEVVLFDVTWLDNQES
jgi:hypothetical protein